MITILYSLRIVRSDGCKCITGMGENRKSGSEKSRRAEGCQLPEEIARHKLFRPISSGNHSPETFSAHFLGKSLATKLFRLISSGNRPPQNFFGQLPEEIARKRPVRRPAKLAGYKKCLIRQAYLAGVPDALCRGRGSRAGYGMYPKRDEENFAGGRSPSFLLLIEEKKQKKIKAPRVPAIFGRVQMGDVKSYVPETFSF